MTRYYYGSEHTLLHCESLVIFSPHSNSQDNVPEVAESFLVNITSVRLASEADRDGSMTDSPRLLAGGGLTTVQIQENDNSRGVVDFAVTAVTISEEPNTAVTLELVRTRGAFGSVGVNYVVRPSSASLDDVSQGTASGVVQFTTGQQRATFMINIINDALPELDEEFVVELESASDGVQIGDQNVANVTILANDDINGVFSFSNTSLLVSLSVCVCVVIVVSVCLCILFIYFLSQLLVSESSSANDPMGVATLTVERSTSFVGEVTVYWEVSMDGIDDLEPSSGNLTFADVSYRHATGVLTLLVVLVLHGLPLSMGFTVGCFTMGCFGGGGGLPPKKLVAARSYCTECLHATTTPPPPPPYFFFWMKPCRLQEYSPTRCSIILYKLSLCLH